MQFTESWLRSFVDTHLSAGELGDKLTMAGLEVEELKPLAPDFFGVVVGFVLKKEKHPDADRLSICQVQVGNGDVRQIVCGATNVAEGLKVPCALPGAVLPNDFTISSTRVRGVDSGGMLCSAKELGITSEVDGLLILSSHFPVGGNVRDLLGLNEMVFTLKMTPNRADCLSVWGVAREVATLTGTPLKAPTFLPVMPCISDQLAVKVENHDICGRFVSRVIRAVDNTAKTPQWMLQRLESAGQRSLNALVDISNYVMLEMGRPSHVFDLDKLQGTLCVRWASEDEKLKLLNGVEVVLTPQMAVISDANGPEALAGIMGGDSTAVSERTQNIFVEAAFWYPNAIAGRTRELNMYSDAAHRFERGVDFQGIPEHLERITALIVEICGGRVGPVNDQVFQLPERLPVTLRHARAEKVIGMSFTIEQVQEVFNKLTFHFKTEGQGADICYVVTPPSYRFDIQIEEDLIEELIRIVGYDRLPLRISTGKLQILPTPEGIVSHHSIRNQVAALGYQEVVTYSFTARQWEVDFACNLNPVRLHNPIANHLEVMRSTLIGSLTGVLKQNLAHRIDRLRVFEVARVFLHDDSVRDSSQTVAGFKQTWVLSGLAYGLEMQLQWGAGNNRQVDFFDVKGDIEQLLRGQNLSFAMFEHPALHPGRSARVLVDGTVIGFLGEMHPRLVHQYDLPQAPLVFELSLSDLSLRKLPVFKEVSRQPVVIRDLAFVVDQSITTSQLEKALIEVKDDNLEYLKSVILFDEFLVEDDAKAAGKGLSFHEKSLAFRLTFQATNRSLTDSDIDPILKRMIEQVGRCCAARLR